jgi:hypothetical protein
MLAVTIAHCGQNWGFWTLLTEMPSYMNSVLKFDLKAVSRNIQFQTGVHPECFTWGGGVADPRLYIIYVFF